MGFRCPACRKDFGSNKKEFDHHMRNAHNGVGTLIQETIDNTLNLYDEDNDKQKES